MENRQNQEMVEIRIDVEGSTHELDKEGKNSTNIGGKGHHDEEEMTQVRVDGKGTEVDEEDKEVMKKIIRREFKQFDIVEYNAQVRNKVTHDRALKASLSGLTDQKINQTSIDRHNRIMQEWKLLKKGLPDSIYVRVLEQRTDFLQAVIIGKAGTPYSDGLFFFHIIFPSKYPSVPPKLYCRSYTTHDFLCISFLDYSYGHDGRFINIHRIKGLEKWNSKESSILEILVSLQLSLHIEKPYFWNHNMNDRRLLEAIEKGYKFDESYAYDERVFKEKCLNILGNLKTPPIFFEEFVAQHFRDRAEAILTACRPYCRVRYGDRPIYETKFSNSYRDSMVNMYAKLLKAFVENGSSLDDYVGEINLEDNFDYVPPLRPECTACSDSLCRASIILFSVVLLILSCWGLIWLIRPLFK